MPPRRVNGWGLNIPRALPLAIAIYGHDVRIVSDPALLTGELVIHDRRSQGARFDAQRTARPGELAGSGVQRYGELTVDTRSRMVAYALVPVELRRREYALLAHMASDPERVWTRHELLRDVWATARPAQRAPLTPTPRACAAHSPAQAPEDGSSRYGESATGTIGSVSRHSEPNDSAFTARRAGCQKAMRWRATSRLS